jgi:uncharacterized protein DUF3135
MDMSKWSQEKEAREKKSLEKHTRLAKLFRENRFAFELERKTMIADLIDGVADKELREKLWSFQTAWDRKMKNAGSPHNRYVLAQTFFWEHFHEKWQATLQKFNRRLNGDHDYGRSE